MSKGMSYSAVVALLAAAMARAGGPLRHEVVVEAPVAEVWRAFTTKEGAEAWMVAHAEMDLRVGGKMRTHYDSAGAIGDPNTIENTILSFEPMRMLSLKATRPPENFPFKGPIESMWSVIHFEELGPQRTRVTSVGMGFGQDEESQKLRDFFDKGNAFTLQKLREHFAGRAAPAALEQVERVVHSLVGEWSFHNTRPDGSVFRGRMTLEPFMDAKFIAVDSWLGDAEKLTHHSRAVFGRDPLSGGYAVWDFGERGNVSGGPVSLAGNDLLHYDWLVRSAGGKTTRYFIEEVLEDSDSLRFLLYPLQPGEKPGEKPQGREPMVNVVWKRSPGQAAGPDFDVAEPQVRAAAK